MNIPKCRTALAALVKKEARETRRMADKRIVRRVLDGDEDQPTTTRDREAADRWNWN